MAVGSDDKGFQLSREQVEVFAAGLYQLAACDGIDTKEVDVIFGFLEENGATDLMSSLPTLAEGFDPARAYRVLETTWLRTLFLRAGLLIVRSDGQVSESERDMIAWMAMAFGVQGGFDALVAQVEGQTL